MQMRMKPTYPIHFIIPSCSIFFPSNNFLIWTLAPPQRKSSPVAAEVQTTSNLAQSIRLPSLFLILTQIFLNSLPLIWIEAKKIWTLETKLAIKWGLWGRWSPNLRVLDPWNLSYIVAMFCGCCWLYAWEWCRLVENKIGWSVICRERWSEIQRELRDEFYRFCWVL